MEQDEIPVLMMRSVLQALTLYPGLAPRVLGILQRLMDKEVTVLYARLTAQYARLTRLAGGDRLTAEDARLILDKRKEVRARLWKDR